MYDCKNISFEVETNYKQRGKQARAGVSGYTL